MGEEGILLPNRTPRSNCLVAAATAALIVICVAIVLVVALP